MRSTDYLKKNGVDVDASLDIFGDIETYNSSVGEFVVGVTEKLNQMNSYKISKDMNNYAIYAHSLKSDANFFGFTKLAELATEMEEKAKSGDMYYVNENFPKLQEEINKSIEVVKEYMNGTDGAPEPAAPVAEEKPAEQPMQPEVTAPQQSVDCLATLLLRRRDAGVLCVFLALCPLLFADSFCRLDCFHYFCKGKRS